MYHVLHSTLIILISVVISRGRKVSFYRVNGTCRREKKGFDWMNEDESTGEMVRSEDLVVKEVLYFPVIVLVKIITF